jgi:hypothetical protein
MTFTIRTLAAALAFTVTGLAQASEVSEPPVAASMKSRADVAAEARRAPVTNELYDGRERAAAMDSAMPRARADVRAEARMQSRATAAPLYIGG